MNKYVKVPTSDIVEKTCKKTLKSGEKVATSEEVVKNVLGK